jgi:hypothetical protein
MMMKDSVFQVKTEAMGNSGGNFSGNNRFLNETKNSRYLSTTYYVLYSP